MKYFIGFLILLGPGLGLFGQGEMTELRSLIPSIRYELKYATRDNFTKVRLYPKNTNRTYLRKEPALALAEVANEFSAMGLGLKVWDAYRPFSVTVRFWELIRDERYVANPAKGGSGHNKGTAIDLTLVDLDTGEELKMPTGFDDFSEAAHHGYLHPDQDRVKNRELLRSIMEKHGFRKLETEWWHYSWPNSEQAEVLDLPIKKIRSRGQ